MHPYLSAPLPHLFGHRGASGEAPENTLVAFERAWEQGVPFLELDCHGTSDGQVVVLHDARVDRTTDGTGPVKAYTWDELTRLDAGYRFSSDAAEFPYRGRGIRVPRLEEVLEAFPQARINLEIKQDDPPIATAVVKRIQEAGATSRTLLAAENGAVLEAVRALAPGTALGMSLPDVLAFFQAAAAGLPETYRPPGHALQIPPVFMGEPLVTGEALEAAHRAGMCVHVWTINDPEEMRRLLDLGVDGLMSDFPARLVAAAKEHRAAPPQRPPPPGSPRRG